MTVHCPMSIDLFGHDCQELIVSRDTNSMGSGGRSPALDRAGV